MESETVFQNYEPWNKGKLVGQKSPLKLKEIWSIRIRLELSHRVRDLALFNLALDSKLRGCDLLKLKVRDISHGEHISARAIVMQQKTGRPVQFEITEQTRKSVAAWLILADLKSDSFLFPSRIHDSPHLPLPTSLVSALLKRSPYGISALIENIVNDFLERTEEEIINPSALTGIYWEAIFLPNGTQIRTKYYGEFKVALIEDEEIIWDGSSYPSFAQLVNAMRGGTMNNAWKELHIKRPSDKMWMPAQSLRR